MEAKPESKDATVVKPQKTTKLTMRAINKIVCTESMADLKASSFVL
jgi:hypothetical protein